MMMMAALLSVREAANIGSITLQDNFDSVNKKDNTSPNDCLGETGVLPRGTYVNPQTAIL